MGLSASKDWKEMTFEFLVIGREFHKNKFSLMNRIQSWEATETYTARGPPEIIES